MFSYSSRETYLSLGGGSLLGIGLHAAQAEKHNGEKQRFFHRTAIFRGYQVVHNIPPLSLAERRSEGWHLVPAFGDFPKKLAGALTP